MKSKDIRRSVQSYRGVRSAGDAPLMGRVARMRGTGLPKEGRRKRSSGSGGRGGRDREYRKKVIRTWSLIVCGSAVFLLAAAICLWLYQKIEPDEDLAGSELPAKITQQERVVSRFVSPSEGDALALVKRCLAIRDPEEIPGCFRMGSASPLEVVDFLKKLESRDGPVVRYEWLSSMDANRLSIDGVFVSFKGGEKPLARLALLTPDAAGAWKLDFDAFARTVKPSWNEIFEKGATPAQVRVNVAKDSYYNGPFKDDKQWSCFRMASPDTEEVLLGYCKVGSRQAAAMNWMFSKDAKMARATLEIRRVDGAERSQFEISQVIAEDWVVSAVPFDEGFNEFK